MLILTEAERRYKRHGYYVGIERNGPISTVIGLVSADQSQSTLQILGQTYRSNFYGT